MKTHEHVNEVPFEKQGVINVYSEKIIYSRMHQRARRCQHAGGTGRGSVHTRGLSWRR